MKTDYKHQKEAFTYASVISLIFDIGIVFLLATILYNFIKKQPSIGIFFMVPLAFLIGARFIVGKDSFELLKSPQSDLACGSRLTLFFAPESALVKAITGFCCKNKNENERQPLFQAETSL